MRCGKLVEREVEVKGEQTVIKYACPSTSFKKEKRDGKVVYICRRCGNIVRK